MLLKRMGNQSAQQSNETEDKKSGEDEVTDVDFEEVEDDTSDKK